MSTENLDGIYSFPAAADFSASQYQAVTINTSGQAALCGANSSVADGMLHNFPKVVGDPARVLLMRNAVMKAKLGTGGATLGALLTTDAVGKLVVATTGQNVVAKALLAGAAGDIIPVLWYGTRAATAP